MRLAMATAARRRGCGVGGQGEGAARRRVDVGQASVPAPEPNAADGTPVCTACCQCAAPACMSASCQCAHLCAQHGAAQHLEQQVRHFGALAAARLARDDRHPVLPGHALWGRTAQRSRMRNTRGQGGRTPPPTLILSWMRSMPVLGFPPPAGLSRDCPCASAPNTNILDACPAQGGGSRAQVPGAGWWDVWACGPARMRVTTAAHIISRGDVIKAARAAAPFREHEARQTCCRTARKKQRNG